MRIGAHASGSPAAFLDQSWNSVLYQAVDVSMLDASGSFSILATAPASGLNIIQVGFRNSGIEGTAAEMTISNLSLTIIPEPATYAALIGLLALGFVVYRRRK